MLRESDRTERLDRKVEDRNGAFVMAKMKIRRARLAFASALTTACLLFASPSQAAIPADGSAANPVISNATTSLRS